MEALCECDAGFAKNDEGFCKDIDECQEPGLCSQVCLNFDGGYKCACHEGYTLEKHHFCRADGRVPWLYYSNRRDIRRLSSSTSLMEIVVHETGNSVGIDIDIEDGILFWTDRGHRAIMRYAMFFYTLLNLFCMEQLKCL